jgi:hypothetical protein
MRKSSTSSTPLGARTTSHGSRRTASTWTRRVNFLVPTFDCTLLCVYDINEISGRMMMEILQTHPYLVYGGRVRENPYYVPPIERLREVLLPGSAPITHDQPIT